MQAVCKGPQVALVFPGSVLGTGPVNVVVTTGDVGTERKTCASFGPSNATVVKDGSPIRRHTTNEVVLLPGGPTSGAERLRDVGRVDGAGGISHAAH